MNTEQKAIKAVANVAAQSYRRAFDVKPDMTTGALAVMADAIAALDQPTLAPKIDKEYVIWRAIGSLTQRVRDLEQPTPAPEPPVIGVSNGKDTIWHDPEVRMVNGIDKCPTCLGTGKVVRLEPVKEEPEASQPLPAAVEAAVQWLEAEQIDSVIDCESHVKMIKSEFAMFRRRLASLWPKAGQVPSVEDEESIARYSKEVAVIFNQWLLSRMGQPVTAEKPAIQGRLTRKAIVDAIAVGLPTHGADWTKHYESIADDLLALQCPMKVSKEQWEKLDTYTSTPGLLLRSEVKAWLKDEFGMEITE